MRKNFLILVLAIISLVSCTKGDINNACSSDSKSPVFTATFENEVVKTQLDNNRQLVWTADDRLSIFTTTYNQQYVFTGETGSNSGDFEEVKAPGFHAGNDLSTNYAVYPYMANTKISSNEQITLNLPAVQSYAEKGFGLGANTMVAVTSCPEDYLLKFKNLCGYLIVKLYGTGSVRSIELTGKNGEKIAGTAIVTASYGEEPQIEMEDEATESITIDCIENGISVGTSSSQATEFWLCVPPTTFSKGFTITVTGTDGQVIEKGVSSSRTILRNMVYTLQAIEVNFSSSQEPLEMVDLGLSVKWASCNIGASKPEEYGDYYAWGEIDTYYQEGDAQSSSPTWKPGKSNGYGWETYKWCKGSYYSITKYCINSSYGTVDGRTVLEPDDDIAHVKKGSGWRMPTIEEYQELLDNCKSEWTTLNGVYGRKFTSKKSGFKDKWIFLPAAGSRLSKDLLDTGSYGDYWSSSLGTGIQGRAEELYFLSDFVETSNIYRADGQSIRPVYGELIAVSSVSLSMNSLEIKSGEKVQLSASVLPANASDKSVTWSSDNSSVATVSAEGLVTGVTPGNAIITVKTVDGGHTAKCSVTVTSNQAVPEMVDLGLSVKWATFNIGASKPEDYGDYYAWGEIETYYQEGDAQSSSPTWKPGKSSGYVCSTNKYYRDGCYIDGKWYRDGYTKYVTSSYEGFGEFTDGKTVLDLEDDVAHVKWGGSWRMPTQTEYEELVSNCTSEWTRLNGVYGRRFTSKKNGNSIFMPASGRRQDTRLYFFEESGFYWSSCIKYGGLQAWALVFQSADIDTTGFFDTLREMGLSVRPVYGELIAVSSVSLNKNSLEIKPGEKVQLSASVLPSNAHDKSVTWSSDNSSVATVSAEGLVTGVTPGNAIITVKTVDGGHTAKCSVTVTSNQAVPEMVDLGLSVKWATFNIGASKPEDYGGYYAWGETEEKSVYNEVTYKYCTGIDTDGDGSYEENRSYQNIGSDISGTQYDVAHVKWGGSWRMPTRAEFEELYNNCTSELTEQNGVKGRRFTSKKNGNSIFLPASGYRYRTYLYSVGGYGLYWSSSLYTDYDSHGNDTDLAWYLLFTSDFVGTSYGYYRYNGLSVRPVSE